MVGGEAAIIADELVVPFVVAGDITWTETTAGVGDGDDDNDNEEGDDEEEVDEDDTGEEDNNTDDDEDDDEEEDDDDEEEEEEDDDEEEDKEELMVGEGEEEEEADGNVCVGANDDVDAETEAAAAEALVGADNWFKCSQNAVKLLKSTGLIISIDNFGAISYVPLEQH